MTIFKTFKNNTQSKQTTHKGSSCISSKVFSNFIFCFGNIKFLLCFPWISRFICKKDLSFLIFLIENISSLLSLWLLIHAGRISLLSKIWIFLLLFAIVVYRANAKSHQLDSTTLNGGARVVCGIGSPAARWDGRLT